MDRLSVEVVRGLVEQKDVRFLDQQPAERDSAALPAGENGNGRIGRRAAQRVHGDLELGLELPAIGRLDLLLEVALLFEELFHLVRRDLRAQLVADLFELSEKTQQLRAALLDDLLDGLVWIELRLLLEESDRVTFRERHLALVAVILPRDDAQKRTLSGTVQTEDADLGAVEKREIDVLQHPPFGRMNSSHANEREDDLSIVVRHVRSTRL